MKKSTIVYILIFLLIGGAAAFVLLNRSNTTLNEDEQDFAIEDTSAVYKIKLSDKQGNISLLEKKSSGLWMVNNKYKVQKSQIDILLETMKLLQVKNPVPMQARDNVIKIMASSAVKIEAFDKDNELLKSYYVGGTTPDELGTLMLLENADEPFVTHIPGFFGYLTSRYIANEKDWRSNEIYKLNPSAIQEVTITYHAVPDASFRLNVRGNDFLLHSLQREGETKMSALKAKQFLSGFRSIVYEQFPKLLPHQQDSILNSQPLITVNVKYQGSKPPVLHLYSKQADERTKGVGPNNTDLDKFYGVIEGSREVFLVQSGVAAKILPSYQELSK